MPRIRIQVEGGELRTAVAIEHSVKTDVRVPSLHVAGSQFETNAEQIAQRREHVFNDRRQRKVLFDVGVV